MPDYQYDAIDGSGRIIHGKLVAFNDDDIEQRLARKGLTLINSKRVKKAAGFSFVPFEKVKPRMLIEFYYRLSQTLELGLPLLSALDENAKIIPSKLLKKTIEEVRLSVESGNTLYEAMARFPKTFEKLDLAIVKMGEQSGILPQSLKDLTEFLEWKDDIRNTIRKASIYPIIIILVIGAVFGVWVGYVLPQMAKMLIDMGVALPGVTVVVLNTSKFLNNNWWILLACIVAFIVSLVGFGKTKKGGILLDEYLLKIPIVGSIANNIAITRLSQNFAAMYSAGMMINSIFENLSDNVIGNRYLEAQLASAFIEIQAGKSIAESFDHVGGFPPILIGAIKNGETTGTIDEAFKRLGSYFDKEVKRSVDTLVGAIQPLSIILLGGVFGLVALSILLPLYDVVSSFGQAY